mmetsp:Transcript_2353/g.5080  ORF Transcript_2353/g.5080 Transcript_2353/m.5080 type:complete len:262 (+) Transcript_2353:1207-1992(+)
MQPVPHLTSLATPGPREGEHGELTTSQEEVENGFGFMTPDDFAAESLNGLVENRKGGEGGEFGAEGVEHGAEYGFGVSVSYGMVEGGLLAAWCGRSGCCVGIRCRGIRSILFISTATRHPSSSHQKRHRQIQIQVQIQIGPPALILLRIHRKLRHLPIMRKRPPYPPHLPFERMDVLQTHRPLRGIPYVGHHIVGLDGVARHHVGDGGFRAREGIVEGADSAAFVDGESPAVGVDVGVSAAAFESSEREIKIRGGGAIHAQ